MLRCGCRALRSFLQMTFSKWQKPCLARATRRWSLTKPLSLSCELLRSTYQVKWLRAQRQLRGGQHRIVGCLMKTPKSEIYPETTPFEEILQRILKALRVWHRGRGESIGFSHGWSSDPSELQGMWTWGRLVMPWVMSKGLHPRDTFETKAWMISDRSMIHDSWGWHK